ncbi:MAG: electron transfer flavoprotein subunit beta [Candidatus Aminicenantes bacterium]|nr:electron transfer flavoprotein subunit beta [Candidatus Aminicenantes bacterium]
MNILVFVKRVPDSESKIKIDHDKNQIDKHGLNFVMNPYDEYAMEEALQIKEAQGGTVQAISVGPEESMATLKKALAMGADEALLIKDDAEETYDGLRQATIIAQAVKEKFSDYDLLLFGKQSIDTDNSQVPTMVAALLGLPQVNVVTKLEIEEGSGTAVREIEGAAEKVQFSLPAVISAQKGLNEPRYETLKGIMAAKRKEVPVISLEDIGIENASLKPKLKLVKLAPPPTKQAGKKIEEEAEEAARQLVEFLHQEAKII